MKGLKKRDLLSQRAQRVYQQLFAEESAPIISLQEHRRMIPEILRGLPPEPRQPSRPSLEQQVVSISSGMKFRGLPEKVLSDYLPRVADIREYARSYVQGQEHDSQFRPIVGEEANIMGQVFCLIVGRHYMVRGGSGSGKTIMVDKVLGLLPEQQIYRAGLSSEVALYRDAPAINQARVIYIPEIQKVMSKKMSPAKELIKDLTENKSSERRRAHSNGQVVTDSITKGKIIVLTGAVENSYMDNEDVELKRRVVHFSTDESEEQIRKINDFYAQQQGPVYVREVFSAERFTALSSHVQQCLDFSFEYIDPFSYSLRQIIPDVSKSAALSQDYYNLLRACAKFHYKERLIDGNKLYLSLQDHHLVHSLYHPAFLNTLRTFNKESLGQEKIALAATSPSWPQWWEQACRIMEQGDQSEGKKLSTQWKEKQLRDNCLYVTNPCTDELLILD